MRKRTRGTVETCTGVIRSKPMAKMASNIHSASGGVRPSQALGSFFLATSGAMAYGSIFWWSEDVIVIQLQHSKFYIVILSAAILFSGTCNFWQLFQTSRFRSALYLDLFLRIGISNH
jgi:hypothetical protein